MSRVKVTTPAHLKLVSNEDTYQFESINAQDIEPKLQPWLWPGFIPLNSVTLFAGEGGIGKSHLLIEIASKISTGEKFSACGFDHQFPQGKVVMLTAEDDFEYTIKPKLMASQADFSQIEILKMSTNMATGKKRFIDLSRELAALRLKILDFGNVKILIIDPILYFIGGVKENYNAEVSNFLGELSDFAKELEIAVVINKHFRKKSSGSSITSAMDEVGGAGSWLNSPRLSWAITRWHEDPNVIVVTNLKANIIKKTTECFAYKLMGCSVTTEAGLIIPTCRLVWLDKMIQMSADEAVNPETYEKSKGDAAFDLVVDYLKEHGQSVSKNVRAAVSAKGFSDRTYERAINQLKRDGMLIIDPGSGSNKLYTLRDMNY